MAMPPGAIRHVSTLVLAGVAGFVGATLLDFALFPSHFYGFSIWMLEATTTLELFALPAESAVRLGGWTRTLLALLGLAHLAVCAGAIWPNTGPAAPVKTLVINNDGLTVRIPYHVVQDYVLKVVKRVDGVGNVNARVEAGRNGVVVKILASLNMDAGTLPELARSLEQTIRRELGTTLGYVSIDDISVSISKVLPRAVAVNEQRQVLSGHESENPISSLSLSDETMFAANQPQSHEEPKSS